MNVRSQEEVVNYITNMLSEFFVITNDPYLGATEYKKNVTSKQIHDLVTKEANKRFKLSPKKIGDFQMEIDLWNQTDKIAYEILLSDGSEIWKDVWKAMIVGASKLVIFCRNYHHDSMRGYSYIQNSLAFMQPYLEGKLAVQVVLIQPTLR